MRRLKSLLGGGNQVSRPMGVRVAGGKGNRNRLQVGRQGAGWGGGKVGKQQECLCWERGDQRT